MTTREMLELAARAANIRWDKTDEVWFGDGVGKEWNPDTDDGDSSRMRTKLRIDVTWLPESVRCEHWEDYDAEAMERLSDHNNDPDAALRLAALRVAAMMGERM